MDEQKKGEEQQAAEPTQNLADKVAAKIPQSWPGPLRNVKILGGLGTLVLVLVLGGLIWAFSGEKEQEITIKESDPASMLTRDDSVENPDPKTQGDTMGTRGETKPLDPKLFVKLGYNGPIYYKDGERWTSFILKLDIDEAACKKYYGNKDGLLQCRNNWDFLQPDPDGWSISPDFGSDWQLKASTYAYEARLDMKMEDFPSDTRISVRAPKKLGDNVVVDKTSHDFTSRKFAMDISSWQFLVDPQDPRKIMLSGTVSGSPFSMDEQSLRQKLSVGIWVKQPDNKPAVFGPATEYGMKLGEPAISFNSHKTEAYVTVPVLKLPQTSTAVALRVEAGVSTSKNKGVTVSDVSKGANVAGQDVFVSLASNENTIITNDDLDKKQMLFLTFTRKVKVDAAQRATRAILLPYSALGEDLEKKRMTNWGNIPVEQIEDEDIARGVPLPLSAVPVPDEYSELVPFSYGADFGRYILIIGKGDVPSNTDYKMHEFSFVSQVPNIPSELRVMQDGTILSMAGAKKLAVMSRGVDEIRVEAYRVRPEYLNLLVTQSRQGLARTNLGAGGGDYDDDEDYYDEYGNHYASSLTFEDVSERFNFNYKTAISNGYQPDYSSVDLSPLLKDGAKGIFRVRLSGYKNNSHRQNDERFLLVTDLGLTVKKSATGERDVFVTSFSRGGAVAQARVQVLGRNGLPIFSKHTDGQGHVSLPELSGFDREKQPVVITVEKSGDFTYIPIEDSSRVVPMSQFPQTAGRTVDKDGISIFAFSERGIFRPGENLRFGLLGKPGNWNAENMAGLPLEARLMDPRGNQIFKQKLKLDRAGLFDLNIPMDENYPTGRYNLDVYLSNNLIGTTSVQVEEFQPDNLKVKTSFKNVPPTGQKGWMLPDDVEAVVEVENLYGTPAVDNRVEASFSLAPTRLSFSKYSRFTFYDPGGWGSSQNQRLSTQNTDEKGEAHYSLAPEQLSGGTYWLTFEAEAFETGGGRSVSSSARLLVSPLKALVGWQSDAKLDFLASNSEAKVNFIAIAPDLERASLDKLSLNISEVTYIASLIKDSSGRYRYENVRKLNPVLDRKVSVDEQFGLELDLPTDKTGEFILTLTGDDDVERCNLTYVVAGGSQRRFGLERDATLRIHLDKKEYSAGDEIKVFISAPYAGSGLITLESDKVYGSKWFKATTSDSVQVITVPDNFEGRAFVSVSLVRDIHSDAIHSTPYTYAVAPFIANIEKRDMKIKVETPDRVQPGDVLTMKVSTEKPGKAIVWAVSEGILQLTTYRTPSPMDYFLRRNPLMVSTMQNLDLIMPEFYLMNRSAYGGDMAYYYMMMAAENAQLNPFRRKAEPSVVWWSGVVEVGPEGRELQWEVPAYFNGTLRIMAVSASEQAIGETARQTQVRGPLIITPDLPVAAAPGDEFEVTAAIANNVEGSGKGLEIHVQAELDEGLVFVTQPLVTGVTVPGSAVIKVDEGHEGKVVFRMKATDRLGESTVRFKAWVEREQADIIVKRPITMSVRPASPRMSSFKAGFVKGDEQVVPVGRNMYDQLSEVEASVSGLPLPLVDGLSGFLIRFPHGCTEQILSKAFPYAILHESPELLPLPKGQTPEMARKNAVAAINRGILTLRERQVQPGRFALWPQERYAYGFLTVYGFDFLLSAKEAGFEVPNDLFEATRKEVAAILMDLPQNRDQARTVCYAAWVYTRSGQRFTGLPELVKHLDKQLTGWRKTTCGALVASCYRMLKQDKEADELIQDVRMTPLKPEKDSWGFNSWFFNRLWDNGLQLNLIARYFPAHLDTVNTRNLLVTAVNDVVGGQYTTTGSVQAVRGIVGYALGNMQSKSELKMYPRNAEHQPLPIEPSGNMVKRIQTDNTAAEFYFGGAAGLYWQITADGFDKTPPPAKAKKINVRAEYIPADGKKLEELAQGDEVYVFLTASATERIDNVAITSLIPGGFEMVISKGGQIVGGGTSGRSSGGDYDEEDDYSDDDWDSGTTRAYPNEAHRRDVYNMLNEAGLKGTPMSLVHVERREDRMIAYATLDTQSKVFIYRIKAINKGSYTLPVVFAEALYDPDARANTNAGRINVK